MEGMNFYNTSANKIHVNYNDAREIVSAASALSNSKYDNVKATALSYFNIGCIAVKNETKLNDNDIANLAKINRYTLAKAKKLAKIYNCDEKEFSKVLDKYGSFRAVVDNEIYIDDKTQRKLRDFVYRFSNKVRKILKDVVDRSEHWSDIEFKAIVEQLSFLKGLLNRHLPDMGNDYSADVLKFEQCASCGEFPNGEEHRIVKDSSGNIPEYPLCPKCHASGNSPDMNRLARLYRDLYKESINSYKDLYEKL